MVEALGAVRRATSVSPDHAEGAALEVMLRPEDLRIEPAGEGVHATVISASYVGGQAMYQVRFGQEVLLAVGVIDRDARLPQAGETVGLRVAEHALRVF